MSKHSFDHLESMASRAMSDLLKHLVYEDNGSYVMYQEYFLTKREHDCVVYRYRDDTTRTFNRLRNAAAWCTLDYYNKFYEASRVMYLDQKLESIEIDKQIHSRQRSKKELESAVIATVKYQHDLHNQKIFRGELDKYIIMAKACQQRGFENELTRTARKQKEHSS